MPTPNRSYGEKSVSKKSTYCVCSKQANEIGNFGRMPVPAEFKTLEEAKLYQRELNLRRGPYHPGYVIQEKDDRLPFFPLRPEERHEQA